MTRRRVVVTGLGIVCPIGNTVSEAWDQAIAGKPGITRITRFDPSRLASQIAGEVKDFDVSPYMAPKDARRVDRFIHFGMAAGLQAWRDAGVQVTPENAERVGVNFGSGIGGLPLIESMQNELDKNGPRRISPFFIPGTIINMIAGLLSIEVGAKGPNLAMVSACTTGTHCIGESSRIIEYGDADVMIAGGAEAKEGGASYNERIVRRGETTPDAMREKARHVLSEMERRLAAFGLRWTDTTATQVYTVHNLYPFLADEIVRRGAAHAGLTWHYAWPPVQGLEYEMDCRGTNRETVV